MLPELKLLVAVVLVVGFARSSLGQYNCMMVSPCLNQPDYTPICRNNYTAVSCVGGSVYRTTYCTSTARCASGLGCLCSPFCVSSHTSSCTTDGTCICKAGWLGTYCNQTSSEASTTEESEAIESFASQANPSSHLRSRSALALPPDAVCGTCYKGFNYVDCDYSANSLYYCAWGCVNGNTVPHCDCNCGSGVCYIPKGTCQCAKGYSACANGFLGSDCTQPSPCYNFADGSYCRLNSTGSPTWRQCRSQNLMRTGFCELGCDATNTTCQCDPACSPDKGTCQPDGKCQCLPGRTGPLCDVVDTCLPALYGSVCTNDNVSHTCWNHQTIQVRECQFGCASSGECACPNNCSGYGSCINSTCHCWRPHAGEDCSTIPALSTGFTIPVILGAVGVIIFMAVHVSVVQLSYKPRLLEHYKHLPYDENDLEDLMEEFDVLNTNYLDKSKPHSQEADDPATQKLLLPPRRASVKYTEEDENAIL